MGTPPEGEEEREDVPAACPGFGRGIVDGLGVVFVYPKGSLADIDDDVDEVKLSRRK